MRDFHSLSSSPFRFIQPLLVRVPASSASNKTSPSSPLHHKPLANFSLLLLDGTHNFHDKWISLDYLRYLRQQHLHIYYSFHSNRFPWVFKVQLTLMSCNRKNTAEQEYPQINPSLSPSHSIGNTIQSLFAQKCSMLKLSSEMQRGICLHKWRKG